MDAGLPDLAGLLAQAQQVQEGLARAQAALEQARLEGSAGGGLVRATVTGTGELVDVSIAPDAVDTADPDLARTLSDLVLAAVRDALTRASALQRDAMGPVTQGLPDLGLPGLPTSGA